MSKHLSISDINKWHSKEFGDKKIVELKNGSYCEVYTKFKPTSIQQLIIDYQEILEQLQKKTDNKEVAKDVTFVFYMLLLKHFSSLGNKIPMDVEKIIVLCEKLIDLGILEELLNAFPQEELGKINEMMYKVSMNTRMIGDQIGELFLQTELAKDESDA